VEAERRQVTVLFADMVGFTSFSERSGEEAAFALMRSLWKLMAEAVREHGGVVQDFTGDGIMAVFGVPVAFEDGPLRASRAALSILQRLNASGPDLEAKHGVRPQMRIGLNTGLAVVGKIDDRADGGDAVLGDTVNFAARLQSIAEPNSVFISEATHRLVQGLVDTSFAGERRIKGKSEPQNVYRLNAVRQGAARFEVAVSRGLSASSDANTNWRFWSAASAKDLPNSALSISWRSQAWASRACYMNFVNELATSAPSFYQEVVGPKGGRHRSFPLSK
jgi:class 3 adenylate cyclase